MLISSLVGLIVVAGFIAAASKVIAWFSFLQHEQNNPVPVLLEDPTSPKPATLPSVFEPATKALSIVVPAYNEEDRLPATLDETLSYLQRRRDKQGPHFTYEIIIVDDGSKDKTARIGYDYSRKYGFDAVRVLRVTKNRGKGHAVKRGMLVCRGELCLLMDADGATRVSDLEALEATLAKNQALGPGRSPSDGMLGAVFGSRAHLERSAAAKRSPLRNFLTKGFHFLVVMVAGGAIKDTQCGFKLFTRRAAALLFSNQRLQRWCFDVELLYLAEQLGIPCSEVPVNWTEMPGSKIRFTSILHMAWELAALKLAYQLTPLWAIFTEPELLKKVAAVKVA